MRHAFDFLGLWVKKSVRQTLAQYRHQSTAALVGNVHNTSIYLHKCFHRCSTAFSRASWRGRRRGAVHRRKQLTLAPFLPWRSSAKRQTTDQHRATCIYNDLWKLKRHSSSVKHLNWLIPAALGHSLFRPLSMTSPLVYNGAQWLLCSITPFRRSLTTPSEEGSASRPGKEVQPAQICLNNMNNENEL